MVRDKVHIQCFHDERNSSGGSVGAAPVAAETIELAFERACEELLMIAQYNELFSVPWARDNEVWIPLGRWPGAAERSSPVTRVRPDQTESAKEMS
jgi:hypothetical protein